MSTLEEFLMLGYFVLVALLTTVAKRKPAPPYRQPDSTNEKHPGDQE